LVLNYSKIYGGKIYGISPVLRFNHLEKYESQYVIFEVTEAIFEVTEAAGIPILRVPKIEPPIFTLHAVAAVAATLLRLLRVLRDRGLQRPASWDNGMNQNII
jgi:hypothetical protein